MTRGTARKLATARAGVAPDRRWWGVPTVDDRLKQIMSTVVLLRRAMPSIVKDLDDNTLIEALDGALLEAGESVFWIRHTEAPFLQLPAPTDDQRMAHEGDVSTKGRAS